MVNLCFQHQISTSKSYHFTSSILVVYEEQKQAVEDQTQAWNVAKLSSHILYYARLEKLVYRQLLHTESNTINPSALQSNGTDFYLSHRGG
jgi:hypothetical protein